MRYMLYDTRHHKVRLNRELEYLKSYIALQQLRFGDAVRTELDIALSDAADSMEIEPMLLIPFVENAFKHGVGFGDDAWMAVQLHLEEKILYFEVKNSFSEAAGKSVDNTSGIGIENVRARLEMLYKGNYTLDIVKTGELFSVNLQLVLV
jgi:two-component system LytT family sensor kinase